jgi:AcrR family transcriptional regulator
MSSTTSPRVRPGLNRRRVLDAALEYVDEHGLEALSMHKLGTRLGVRGMSLYNHVKGKDGLLDGLVDLLWSQIDTDTTRFADWQAAVRALAGALRELVRRHPGAAPLIMTRRLMPHSALHVADAYLRVMRDGGVPEECAAALLRTVISYAIGQTLAEIRYAPPGTDSAADKDPDEAERVRLVDTLIPDGTPEELAHVAYAVCGACGTTRQFDIGVDLMIHGLTAYLDELGA